MAKVKAKQNLAKDVKTEVDITKMSVKDLKVLAYDTIGEMERVHKNLKLINDQIVAKE